ncbi:tRNA dimethylallyltransferase 2 [Geobacter sp. OR-1]|uniref:tRNA (adenosine(37)-N6)-dimethylallyltransferase MiaA n=1 Tax=Geobacter sp. OR-1 TaxID=1266765 RepID=UPI0005421276|nr:tRNA (adenosine(37)-N6)-dimethylallyltransferase MiaA [Geobacter sp. OR-1]GAM11592.1 tRNA dimethylallyltransferase 2 [Geobacter sp. OR-1]
MNSSRKDGIRLVVVQGPTASGKTDLAIRLAEAIGGEIVNADSMQVYRGMDIGTAKPSPDLQQRVPHHLVDIVTPDQNFSAGDFRRAAVKIIEDIHSRGLKPIIVGGTGLYIRALLKGLAEVPPADTEYRDQLQIILEQGGGKGLLAELAQVDPLTAAVLHPNDHVRIVRALEVFRQTGSPISKFRQDHGFKSEEYRYLKIGIRLDREELYDRINHRVEKMICDGLENEVRGLINAGYGRELKSMNSIGYREMCAYIAGEASPDEAVDLIKRNTRRYGKRQETWLKGDAEISWVEYPKSFATIKNHVNAFFD